MKKLERKILRPEVQPGYEKEAWRPTWKCYCCHDTGFISDRLVRRVVENYQRGKDKYPICQNPGCGAAERKISETIYPSIDFRFDGQTCQELDQIERESWEQTLWQWHLNRQPQPTVDLSWVKSMRSRDRDPQEEKLAQQQHAAVTQNANA